MKSENTANTPGSENPDKGKKISIEDAAKRNAEELFLLIKDIDVEGSDLIQVRKNVREKIEYIGRMENLRKKYNQKEQPKKSLRTLVFSHQDNEGNTALHLSLKLDEEISINILDAIIKTEDLHPLTLVSKKYSGPFFFIAIQEHKHEIIKRLLQHKNLLEQSKALLKNPLTEGPLTGCTPLIYAIQQNDKETITLLLEKIIGKQIIDGSTSQNNTVEEGYKKGNLEEKCPEYSIVDKQEIINYQDLSGNTPLHHAVQQFNGKTSVRNISSNLSIESPHSLDIQEIQKTEAIIKMLVLHGGADISILNNEGKTPLDLINLEEEKEKLQQDLTRLHWLHSNPNYKANLEEEDEARRNERTNEDNGEKKKSKDQVNLERLKNQLDTMITSLENPQRRTKILKLNQKRPITRLIKEQQDKVKNLLAELKRLSACLDNERALKNDYPDPKQSLKTKSLKTKLDNLIQFFYLNATSSELSSKLSIKEARAKFKRILDLVIDPLFSLVNGGEIINYEYRDDEHQGDIFNNIFNLTRRPPSSLPFYEEEEEEEEEERESNNPTTLSNKQEKTTQDEQKSPAERTISSATNTTSSPSFQTYSPTLWGSNSQPSPNTHKEQTKPRASQEKYGNYKEDTSSSGNIENTTTQSATQSAQ